MRPDGVAWNHITPPLGAARQCHAVCALQSHLRAAWHSPNFAMTTFPATAPRRASVRGPSLQCRLLWHCACPPLRLGLHGLLQAQTVGAGERFTAKPNNAAPNSFTTARHPDCRAKAQPRSRRCVLPILGSSCVAGRRCTATGEASCNGVRLPWQSRACRWPCAAPTARPASPRGQESAPLPRAAERHEGRPVARRVQHSGQGTAAAGRNGRCRQRLAHGRRAAGQGAHHGTGL